MGEMGEMQKPQKLPRGVELEPGEQLVMLVRQHWVVFRDPFLLVSFVPFVAVSVLFFIEYTDLSTAVINGVGMLALYTALFSVCVGVLWFLWKFYMWRNTIYILTDKRIILINQLGLFTHDDRETGLNMIQDVRARVDGLQATLYGYGDVVLQVSSEDAQLRLERVGKPREVQRVVIREAHLRGITPGD